MVNQIDKDRKRFKNIVKGVVKRQLKKYVTNEELVGKKGKNLISIPVPQIKIPRFMYDYRKMGGVGQGEGFEPGSLPSEHLLEVEFTLEELAQILGEGLELPNVQPKGKREIVEESNRYSTIAQTGPESLRHFKRTFREALKRELLSGTYDPKKPRIRITKKDKRYRSWQTIYKEESAAVIFYIMDISSSMDFLQEIVRLESFWIDTWLRSQYKNVEMRYIVHDSKAKEVSAGEFYYLTSGGGTAFYDAYKLCNEIINEKYPFDDWNVYMFHFTDGGTFGYDDDKAIELLWEKILPRINLFGYAEVENEFYPTKVFSEKLDILPIFDNFVISKLKGKDGIYDSIKDFLGKGK